LQEKHEREKAAKVMDKLNELISPRQFPINYIDLQNIAEFYAICGKPDKAREFAQMVVERTSAIIGNRKLADYENGAKSPYYEPYLFQCDAFSLLGDITQAKNALQGYIAQIGNDGRAKFRTDAIDIRAMAMQGKVKEAINAAQVLTSRQTDPAGMQELMKLVSDLQLMAGESPTNAPPAM
jgi:hypothetical protein